MKVQIFVCLQVALVLGDSNVIHRRELPPLNGCGPPTCEVWDVLFPHVNPELFWQCVADQPVERQCAPGTLFSYGHQVCVHREDWENPCDLNPLPSSSTTSTVRTTENPGTLWSTSTVSRTTEAPGPIETTTRTTERPYCTKPMCNPSATDRTFYPDLDPTKYWQCMPGSSEAILMSCITGNYYSDRIKACVDPMLWENPCEITITTRTTSGTSTTTTPSTTRPTETSTGWSKPSLPPLQNCHEPQCEGSDIYILWPHIDPTKFYQCAPNNEGSWSPKIHNCPAPLLFSYTEQVCAWEYQWENPCNSTTTPTTTPKPPLPPLEHCEEPSCEGSGIFVLWPHIDSTKFYQCAPDNEREWAPKIHNCPASLLFSYEEQVCVWPYQWENPCNVTTTPTTPKPGVCLEPVCDPLEKERTFYPNTDPTTYWQCIPGYPEALLMACISNNYYSDQIKACVDPALWENPCKIETTTTAPTTTTKPPTTTTKPPTTTTKPPTTTTKPPTTTTKPQTTTPSPGKCDEPDCKNCANENLYPAWDPNCYWQCVPGHESAFYMKCPAGLFFSDKLKVCVYCDEWENPCNVQNVTNACSFDNPMKHHPDEDAGKIWEAMTGFFN